MQILSRVCIEERVFGRGIREYARARMCREVGDRNGRDRRVRDEGRGALVGVCVCVVRGRQEGSKRVWV